MKTWQKIIDLVTVIWLVVFALSMAGIGASWTGWVLGAIGCVYVIDLVVIFKQSKNLREFLRRSWLDLLLLIPFLRVFRVGRFARALKKSRHLTRLLQTGVLDTGIQAIDLGQKSLERIRRIRI